MNKYYYKNKRDNEGVLISYKAYQLYDKITEEAFISIKNYQSLRDIENIIPKEFLEFYFKKRFIQIFKHIIDKIVIDEFDRKNNTEYKKLFIQLKFDDPSTIIKKIFSKYNLGYKNELKNNFLIIKKLLKIIVKLFYSIKFWIYKSKKKFDFDLSKNYIGIKFSGEVSQNFRSEIFWLNKSNIEHKNIILYFETKEEFNKFYTNKKLYNEIKKKGANIIKLWDHKNILKKNNNLFFHKFNNPIDNTDKWIINELKLLLKKCNYWYNFFSFFNIKIHADPDEFAIVVLAKQIAIDKLKSCSYGRLRSYPNNSPATFYCFYPNDIFFTWSKNSIKRIIKTQNPDMNYIITGYIYGAPTKEINKKLSELKSYFLSLGVNKLILFLDSNISFYDTAQGIFYKDYENFLLKIIELVKKNTNIGLLIKSKKINDLMKLNNIINNIKELDRCVLIKDRKINGSDYAHISNFAIGFQPQISSIFMESIIVCRKGVFYDYGNLRKFEKEFYSKTKKNIISYDLEEIIHMIKIYITNDDDDVGNWSSYLNEIDPYQDGNGDRRIGQYISYIFEGYNKKLSKEKIIKNANQRYSNIYGNTMVVSKGNS